MIYVICGKKRVGKDTAATILESHGIIPVALADRLKGVLTSSSNDVDNDMYIRDNFYKDRMFTVGDREKALPISNDGVVRLFEIAYQKVKGMTYLNNDGHFDKLVEKHVNRNVEPWTIRRLMQTFGTDIMCDIDNRIWVMYAMRRILGEDGNDFVITDCRQPHEQTMLRKFGAKFIFINKDTGLVDNHSTEQGLIPQPDDVIVDNNGTIEQLKNQLIEIMK